MHLVVLKTAVRTQRIAASTPGSSTPRMAGDGGGLGDEPTPVPTLTSGLSPPPAAGRPAGAGDSPGYSERPGRKGCHSESGGGAEI